MMEYEILKEISVELILSISKSVNYECIKPIDLWPRIQSALYGAAVKGQTFGDMIALIGKKLLIDTYGEKVSLKIHEMSLKIEEFGFEKFRDICEREALYIVAEAQALKALRRKKNG